ncbi:MAG: hypothetical protein AABY22_20150 [Nanoarchaeota archaeon]
MKTILGTYYSSLEEAKKKVKKDEVIIQFSRKILDKKDRGYIVVKRKYL